MFVPTTRATSQCTLKERLSFIGRIMVASRQSRSGKVRSQSWDAIWVDTVKRGPMTRVLRRKCLAQGPFTSKDVGPFSRREGLFQIKRPHSIKLQHNGPIQYKNSKHAKLHEAIAAIPMAMTASA